MPGTMVPTRLRNGTLKPTGWGEHGLEKRSLVLGNGARRAQQGRLSAAACDRDGHG